MYTFSFTHLKDVQKILYSFKEFHQVVACPNILFILLFVCLFGLFLKNALWGVLCVNGKVVNLIK